MKNNLLILIAFVFLSFSGLDIAYGQSQSSTREQAITHLSQLVDTYEVDLSSQDKLQVRTICRDLQSSTIAALSVDIEPLRKKYLNTSKSIESTIKFTANSMHKMSEDSSNLDLAGVHLASITEEYDSSVDAYSKSLEELQVIDCQIFPELFVAGLEEARFRRKLVLASAEELVEFNETELKDAFNSSLERLKEIERRQ